MEGEVASIHTSSMLRLESCFCSGTIFGVSGLSSRISTELLETELLGPDPHSSIWRALLAKVLIFNNIRRVLPPDVLINESLLLPTLRISESFLESSWGAAVVSNAKDWKIPYGVPSAVHASASVISLT
jgi:hypothetical protein